ncbi:ABC transporter ATP-binding protein [Herbiconiux sp. A18JL235]|uniref:ABC transporter ATP-binding protein n=1 Tax=Herbiconiux sp. A18JL235 TaxID=3152363 RepID=A0AB39BEH9_9MICO
MTGATPPATDRLPVAPARVVWREVRRSLRGRIPTLMLLGLVLLGAAAAGIVSPIALGAVVDAIAAGSSDTGLLWGLGATMTGAIVAAAVLTGCGIVLGSRLFETVLADLRERMVASALALPQQRVERGGSGDLVSRAGDDVTAVANAIPEVLPALSGSLFTIALTVAGMAVVDPWFALVLLVVVPVHVLAVRWYLRTAPQVYAAERAAMAARAQQLLDSLHGLDTVRAYRMHRRHIDGISRSSWQVVRWVMRTVAVQNAFFARLNLAEFLGMAGLLVAGFVLVGAGQSTVGATTAAMLLFLRLFAPINSLLFVVDQLQSALASLGRIVGVIAEARATRATDAARGTAGSSTDAAVGTADTLRSTAPDALRLRGVHHSYRDGHPVLHDVTLDVEPGETLAVVGATGAGKSTIAGLAAGTHDAARGEVTRPTAPHRIALVTQEVHVFDGSLRDNLTLAAPDASDEQLVRALERIGAAGLIDALPSGLDTRLGAAATTVSSAEAQQIALARVELAAPALVVLDEATAEAGSLDAHRLDAAAAAVVAGRTALVVAHRLSQAAAADRIAVLRDGRVVELGTHTELVAAGGEYSRLWTAWSAGR